MLGGEGGRFFHYILSRLEFLLLSCSRFYKVYYLLGNKYNLRSGCGSPGQEPPLEPTRSHVRIESSDLR